MPQPPRQGTREAKLDLAWMLGLFGKTKYVDRYLADDEEDIDELGEDWKRDK
ncbi:MAG TPA: hypothetical protein VJN70_16440 [Gemmatimonadaceae bacterium]|nr:hypothetical protein [Gemmatimonadaceae bacterium]